MIFSCSSGRLRLSAWSSFWKMATSHLQTISCRASEATRRPWSVASRCRVFLRSLYRRCSSRYMQTHVQHSCCRDICSLSSRQRNGYRRWNRLERWPECGLNGKGRVVVSTRPFIYMVAADTTFFFAGANSFTLITIFGTGISKKQM